MCYKHDEHRVKPAYYRFESHNIHFFFLSNIESMNMCTLSLDCLEINAIGTP